MFNAQLSRRENEVMTAVFLLSQGKEMFLVTPYELMRMLPARAAFDEEKLERTLRSLELDGYFEWILSDRKGEKMYVIRMHPAGLSYRRDDVKRRRDLVVRLLFAGVCGLLSAAIGLLLKAIIS